MSAALIVALVLSSPQAAAPIAVQGAAGEAKLKQWSAYLGAGRLADAAAMMGPTVEFRYHPSRKGATLSSVEFLRRLADCKPRFSTGPITNYTMPGKPATWNYQLLCPALSLHPGKSPAEPGDVTFFVSATATGVRIW